MVTGTGRNVLSSAGAVLRRRWRAVAGVAVLVLLGRRLGNGPFLDAVHAVSVPDLFLALLLGVATTVLSAWRWSLTAAGLGLRLPLAGAVGDYYRALFLNAVLPGGVLGDVDRAVRHGKDVGDVGLAARAVVLERCAGQVVLVAAAAGVLLLDDEPLPLPAVPSSPVALGVGVGVVLAVLAVAVGAAVLVARGRGRGRASSRRPDGRPAWWVAEAGRALGDPGRAAGILAASVGVLAGHLATFLLAARAVGSSADAGRLLPLGLLALLAMGVPLNVGGWGPREGVTAWAFAAAGMGAAAGLTTAVVYGLFALVASLPGAAVPLAGRVTRRLGSRLGSRPASGTRPVAVPVALPVAVPVGPAAR